MTTIQTDSKHREELILKLIKFILKKGKEYCFVKDGLILEKNELAESIFENSSLPQNFSSILEELKPYLYFQESSSNFFIGNIDYDELKKIPQKIRPLETLWGAITKDIMSGYQTKNEALGEEIKTKTKTPLQTIKTKSENIRGNKDLCINIESETITINGNSIRYSEKKIAFRQGVCGLWLLLNDSQHSYIDKEYFSQAYEKEKYIFLNKLKKGKASNKLGGMILSRARKILKDYNSKYSISSANRVSLSCPE